MKLKERIAQITSSASPRLRSGGSAGSAQAPERRNRRAAMEATVRHHVRELAELDAADEAQLSGKPPSRGLRRHVADGDHTGTIQQRMHRGIEVVESWGESREGGCIYIVVTSDGRGAFAHADTAVAATLAVINALGAEEFAFLLVAPDRT